LTEGLPSELEEIGNKLHRSLILGVLSAIMMIIYAYLPNTGFDEFVISILLLVVMIFWIIGLVKYIQDGLLQIPRYRACENVVNDVERSTTIQNLYDIL
jgi:uncharacterized membrane protein